MSGCCFGFAARRGASAPGGSCQIGRPMVVFTKRFNKPTTVVVGLLNQGFPLTDDRLYDVKFEEQLYLHKICKVIMNHCIQVSIYFIVI